MRTAFFVDGYNLYYGVLHGSDHKWLDLPALLAEILRIQEPSAELVSVDYFTSPVISRLATRGQISNDAQNRCIRALQARGVSVTLGTHRLAKGYAPRYLDGQKPSRQDQVAIWQLEEKETDVNLALGMYRAACRSVDLQLDQIVLVSGDTDLAPGVQLAIYNKTEQARATDKLDYWEGVWRRRDSFDEGDPDNYNRDQTVWRVELPARWSACAIPLPVLLRCVESSGLRCSRRPGAGPCGKIADRC